ncbi:MAG TPA: hypothetical protein VNJ01_15905 [Bacteriovoracaceae bacterium]|nr:hypothetical protein [Bacteriovoracaceae bacterium]
MENNITNNEINNSNKDLGNEKNLSDDGTAGHETEIDLAELDETEVNLDRDGVDNSQDTEVHEFGEGESSGSPRKQVDVQPRAGLKNLQ